MNRTFEERKSTKVYAKSKENQTIIKALNMYGSVPEQWELLNEIEQLNSIINKKNIEITILKNKLDMIKNNVDDLIKRKDKQSILDIIEIYTGFWGKGDESE